MPRLPPCLAVLTLCALLVGCTTGGTERGDAPAVPAPAEAISVSPLPPAAGLAPPAPAEAAPPRPAAAEAGPGASAPAAAGATAPPADAPTASAAPLPAPLSAEARACQRTGGRYLGPGTGALRACVRATGEGAKRCTRETDCKGVCLARSGTCAPVTPLFGCNEILQADGRRVTLCIE